MNTLQCIINSELLQNNYFSIIGHVHEERNK